FVLLHRQQVKLCAVPCNEPLPVLAPKGSVRELVVGEHPEWAAQRDHLTYSFGPIPGEHAGVDTTQTPADDGDGGVMQGVQLVDPAPQARQLSLVESKVAALVPAVNRIPLPANTPPQVGGGSVAAHAAGQHENRVWLARRVQPRQNRPREDI